jgi:hypothetical protein
MTNLTRAIMILDSRPDIGAMLSRMNGTPPPALRDIVDAVSRARNVTLYKETK